MEIPASLLSKIKSEIDEIPTLRSIDLVDLSATDSDFKKEVLSLPI
jgi:hypothetical protein